MFYKAATNGNDKSEFIKKYLHHKNKKKEEKLAKNESAAPEKKHVKEEAPKDNKIQEKKKSSNTSKPKGIISEKDDHFDKDIESSEIGSSNAAMKKGTGMKLNSKIFMHKDILNENEDEIRPVQNNVDLEAIKGYVKEITKTTNPIGKIVEFLSDDVDSMNKELQNWIKEAASYSERFEIEVKKTDEQLLPLQNELVELEDSINDEKTQIKSIKSRLIKNEDIIYNLITNVISYKEE